MKLELLERVREMLAARSEEAARDAAEGLLGALLGPGRIAVLPPGGGGRPVRLGNETLASLSGADGHLEPDLLDAAAAVVAEAVSRARHQAGLSVATHELRSPLTAVRAAAEVLRADPDDPETVREMVSIIHDEAVRTTRLANHLLELSRLRSGRLDFDFREDDLARAAARAVRSTAGTAAGRGLAVELRGADAPVPARFDRDRIVQVLLNLVGNALRHSPPGRPVLVEIEPGEDEVRLEVRDRGPGVPEGHRESVFEGRRVSEPGGARGLGLAISRDIVDAHGGRIWVEEAPGGGAAFVFTVPRAGPPPDAART